MLTYKEMAEPARGWRLEQVRNVAQYSGRRYWEVVLFRSESRTSLSYSDADLERAWQGAIRAAENYELRAVA